MSNYIEYKDRMAFHPGYYIQEELEALEMTQEEFAKRLDTRAISLNRYGNEISKILRHQYKSLA